MSWMESRSQPCIDWMKMVDLFQVATMAKDSISLQEITPEPSTNLRAQELLNRLTKSVANGEVVSVDACRKCFDTQYCRTFPILFAKTKKDGNPPHKFLNAIYALATQREFGVFTQILDFDNFILNVKCKSTGRIE